jgi:hypothetical protein
VGLPEGLAGALPGLSPRRRRRSHCPRRGARVTVITAQPPPDWRARISIELRAIGEATPLDQVGAFLDVSLKALAAAGLFVYAIVRLAIDAFYRPFDVTAEEVGLTQSTIIGRAAVYLFVVIGAFVAFLVIAFVAGEVIVGLLSLGRIRRIFADPYADVVYVILLLWVIWSVHLIRQRALGSFAVYSLSFLCIGVGVGFAAYGLDEVANGRHWTAAGQAQTEIGIVLIMFGVAAWTWLQGRLLALRVLAGNEVSGRILNLKAVEVFVTWTGEDAPPWLDTSRPYLFLGEGDRWLVLFDPQKSSALRVPTGRAALSSTHVHLSQPFYTVLIERFRARLHKWRSTRGRPHAPNTDPPSPPRP